MSKAEKIVQAAKDVNVTLARSTVLKDNGKKGYLVREVTEKPGKFFINRQDIAAFMVDAVEETKWYGKAMTIYSM